jgi:hypothetical protein
MKKNMILKRIMSGASNQPAPTAPPNNNEPSPTTARTAITNRNISLSPSVNLPLEVLEQLWRTHEDPVEVSIYLPAFDHVVGNTRVYPKKEGMGRWRPERGTRSRS